jgi:hypothetical protein
LLTFFQHSAQHFGVVLSGILPGKVAKSKEARSHPYHRFHLIEQAVTLAEISRSSQPSALSPRNTLVLFYPASFPARLQKEREV